MSFISELSSLIEKYPDIDYNVVIGEEDAQTAKQCLGILCRLIKKDPKHKKPADRTARKLTGMQKKKLAEKAFIVSEIPMAVGVGNRRKCYVCKGPIVDPGHHFYDAMCQACGDFNIQMRNKQKDLTGMIAIVTGGRIKIGHEVALWLLRNNCYVIVTTRFPADALLRFKKNPDYESFKDRLMLYGLDFRNLKHVYQFIDYVQSNYKQINILINNAAQTLYQTDSYNNQLLQDEETALKAIQDDPDSKINSDFALAKPATTSIFDNKLCLPEKEFPVYDINHIPVDFSSKNSWNKEVDEVDFREFAEAQIINSWVPFILCSKLKHMMQVPNKKSFIINVSAMEGKFDYKDKKSTHPHTNMAKAAMNMLTRTCGSSFAKNGIFMTSVDTGWCTEMDPDYKFNAKRTVPLDEVDGAMRILHPIFDDLDLHSILLKDYKATTW